jgi:hypothetical protein
LGLDLGAKREGVARNGRCSTRSTIPIYITQEAPSTSNPRSTFSHFPFTLPSIIRDFIAYLACSSFYLRINPSMDNFHYALTAEQLQSFQEHGYLLVRGFFNPEETKLLQQWAQEVHDLPQTPGVPWMPYEEVNGQGERVLCRTENFANSHSGFDSFLRGQRATSVLQQLAGEEMLLFKEKINYKLAGSGMFLIPQ